MITCPRCGFQAPDGTPWCPRCGYGCPYPVPYQQQYQQMLVQYQPQPIPAQYDVVDVPPQPDPEPKPKQKRRKKKKKLPKWMKIILIIIGFISLPFVILVIWAIADTIKNPPAIPTRTPTATFTATVTMTPTETMTLTFTPIPPTATPIPSDTPAPTDTPVPVVAAPQDQTYSNNSGIRGSVVQGTTGSNCNIKGNVNSKGERIYHCLNSRNYDDITMHPYEGDTWFCSPEEAEAAGFRRPQNMSWCQQ